MWRFGVAFVWLWIMGYTFVYTTWLPSQGKPLADITGWRPAPVFLPGKFHGQRSLAGYSPLGFKELDITEHTRITIYCNKSYLNVDSVSIKIPYSPNLLPFFILSKYSLYTVALTFAVLGMTAELLWFLFPFSHVHSYCRSNFSRWFFFLIKLRTFTFSLKGSILWLLLDTSELPASLVLPFGAINYYV